MSSGAVERGDAVGRGYDEHAGRYDRTLAHNRSGAERLVAALPAGDYRDVLDVGCGTGFVSEAVAARFGPVALTGVDPSEGMLERFRAKADELGLEATLVRGTVDALPVPEAAFDLVVSGMAFHWFPDQPGAILAMARRLRPGGVLGVLGSGYGSDLELRDLMRAVEPALPALWIEVFAHQRSHAEMASFMEAAGLEVIDAWDERRLRRLDADAYMDRIITVSSHLRGDLDEAEADAHMANLERAVRASAGPRGFEYTFTKLYGIARLPA